MNSMKVNYEKILLPVYKPYYIDYYEGEPFIIGHLKAGQPIDEYNPLDENINKIIKDFSKINIGKIERGDFDEILYFCNRYGLPGINLSLTRYEYIRIFYPEALTEEYQLYGEPEDEEMSEPEEAPDLLSGLRSLFEHNNYLQQKQDDSTFDNELSFYLAHMSQRYKESEFKYVLSQPIKGIITDIYAVNTVLEKLKSINRGSGEYLEYGFFSVLVSQMLKGVSLSLEIDYSEDSENLCFTTKHSYDKLGHVFGIYFYDIAINNEVLKYCKNCGDPFIADRKNKLFCTKSCRDARSQKDKRKRDSKKEKNEHS
jgi:hypothetical protein